MRGHTRTQHTHRTSSWTDLIIVFFTDHISSALFKTTFHPLALKPSPICTSLSKQFPSSCPTNQMFHLPTKNEQFRLLALQTTGVLCTLSKHHPLTCPSNQTSHLHVLETPPSHLRTKPNMSSAHSQNTTLSLALKVKHVICTFSNHHPLTCPSDRRCPPPTPDPASARR